MSDMLRKDAGYEVRKYFGERMIHHEQWKSLYPWATQPQVGAVPPVGFLVGHHHGASAQIPRIDADIRAGMSTVEAECKQMRYVDYIHKVGNGWERGFAYNLGVGARSGLIFEGRSLWWRHGAHLQDTDDNDFAVYQMIGVLDAGMTEAQKDGYFAIQAMLKEVMGFISATTDLKLHKEVQTSKPTACCDPHFGKFIRQVRTGSLLSPASPFVFFKPSDAVIDWLFATGLAHGDAAYWKALPAWSGEWAGFTRVLRGGLVGWAFSEGHAQGDPAYWLSLDPASPEWGSFYRALGQSIPRIGD